MPLEKLYNGNTWNGLCHLAGVTARASELNVELSRAVSKKGSLPIPIPTSALSMIWLFAVLR